MGSRSLLDTLNDALGEPAAKARRPARQSSSFDYDKALPATLEVAVAHVARLLDGPLAGLRATEPRILDDIRLFIERIIAGKLSHLPLRELEKWFSRGVVKQPGERPLYLSVLSRTARQVDVRAKQLAGAQARIRDLEREPNVQRKKPRRTKVLALERAYERRRELEEQLGALTLELRNRLSSIAMLVAQE